MSQLFGPAGDRKAALKSLIRALHEGADPEQAKRQFAEILRGATAEDIARVEEEMIREGMPRSEVERLCDVHLAVFQESLEREEAPRPAGHPIQMLTGEHELLLQLAGKLRAEIAAFDAATDQASAEAAIRRARQIAQQMKDSESHYLREENVLFPHLERHGVVEPPAIMWSEHDKIRAAKKDLFATLDAARATGSDGLAGAAEALSTLLSSHFYKENNILFPTAMKLFPDEEWEEVSRAFGEIGYWQVAPAPAREPERKPAPAVSESGGIVTFATGAIPLQTLEAILDTMPVDFTFVDAEDTVRYFSNGKERVFPRTTAILGRKVQQCHPQKSVHVVSQILEDFRSGCRDSAEFWIQSGGRFLSIRYFAVRGPEGGYLGCLEVTQDATELRALEGEKRLL